MKWEVIDSRQPELVAGIEYDPHTATKRAMALINEYLQADPPAHVLYSDGDIQSGSVKWSLVDRLGHTVAYFGINSFDDEEEDAG
jgi:hypothetical protein